MPRRCCRFDCASKLWKTTQKISVLFVISRHNHRIHGINLMMLRWDIFVLQQLVIRQQMMMMMMMKKTTNRGLLCNKQNSLLASFIILFTIFIAFIVGTVIKTLEGY